MPNFIYYDYMKSRVCLVKEDQTTYETDTNIKKYLDRICLENGSTLKGRMEAYKYNMSRFRRIPILVNQHLLYFPVSTVDHMEDTYVNMYAISHIEYQEKMCTIHFLDHTHLNCKNPKQIEKTYFYSRQYALHF